MEKWNGHPPFYSKIINYLLRPDPLPTSLDVPFLQLKIWLTYWFFEIKIPSVL
jgi:hypothetical protein